MSGSISLSSTTRPRFGFLTDRVLVPSVSKLQRLLSSYQGGKFVEDTLSSMGSRLLVSATSAERAEIVPTELIENVFVYMGLGKVAQASANGMGRLAGLTSDLTFKPLAQLSPRELVTAIPARLATLVAAFGTMLLGGEGCLITAKNLIGTRLFHQGSFAGVLGKSQTSDDAHVINETDKKARLHLKQYALAALGSIVAGLGLAKVGPALLGKLLKHTPEKLVALAERLKPFDLMASGKVDLSLALLATYMGLSGLIYVRAARDKNEVIEIIPRFAVIMSYLLFFKQKFEQKLIFPWMAETFSGLVLPEGKGLKGTGLSNVLASEAFKALDTAKQLKVKRIAAIGFLAPYIVGTGIVSLTNAALNRYFTNRRITKQHQALQQLVYTKMKTLQASRLQGTYLTSAFSALPPKA